MNYLRMAIELSSFFGKIVSIGYTHVTKLNLFHMHYKIILKYVSK